MVRRIAFFAVVAVAGTYLVMPAGAQDDRGQPRRFSSLSERLDSFRRDLLGTKKEEDARDVPQGVTRKVTRRPKPTTSASRPSAGAAPEFAPSRAAEAAVASPAEESMPQGPIGPEVEQPSYLTPQAARRAQSGSEPVTFEPAAIARKNKLSPGRRPVIIRPGAPQATQEPLTARAEDGDQADQDDGHVHSHAAEDATEPEVVEDSPRGNPREAEADASQITTSDEPAAAIRDAADEPTPAVGAGEVTVEAPDGERWRPEPAAAAESASSAADEEGDVLFTSRSPVLSVEATGPRKIVIGKEAHFAVKIHNAGAAANNVVVTVNIPGYVDVLSAQATSGAANPPAPGERREPMEWKINRLEANRDETLNLNLVARKSTPLDLAVQWTFTPEASQTSVEVQEPKLTMAISGPDEVLYGQSKTYKLTVSNPGNGDTNNVTVGLLPIGRSGDGAGNHRLGTLRAGESKMIDIELTARQAGAITIKAQAFADGGLRAEAAEQVLVRRAALRVEVAAPKIKYAGTVGTYRVKVTNSGNATGENVQVSALLPAEAKYVSSSGGGRIEPQVGKVTWTVGTLQPGSEKIFEMQCSLSAPGENRAQFVAAADGDLSAAATSTTHVEALADLKLEIRDPRGPVPVGDDALYEVHVHNRGTKNAEGIDLAVFFSEGLEAMSVEGGAHDIAAGQVIFRPLGTLAAGDTAVFRVHAKADRVGNHIFRAEVVCQSPQMKLAAEEATHFYGEDAAPPKEIGSSDGAPSTSRGEISSSR